MSAGKKAKTGAKAKTKPKAAAKTKVKAKVKAKVKTKPKAKSGSKPKPSPLVEIQVQSPFWDQQAGAEAAVRAAVAAAAALSTSGGEVSILLADDSAVQRLNRDWRGIDKPTNVLSFPAPESMTKGVAAVLGDIVIAYETLTRECADEDREFLHHLTHLTVHGYLHLVGYDHQNDLDAQEMEMLESKIMTRMKLPDPWNNVRRVQGGA